MSSNKCVITLLIFCGGTIGILSKDVVMSDLKQTWKEMVYKNTCPVAGLDLQSKPFQKNIDFHVDAVDTNTGMAWIGAYVVYTPWLKFTGCFLGKIITNVSGFNIKHSTEPIQSCYYRCKGKFFLSHEWCYCHDEIQYLTGRGCLAWPCNRNLQDFCGEMKNNTAMVCMCVYSPINVTDDGKIGNCKTLDGRKFATENCSEHNSYACMYNRKYRIKYFSEILNWSSSAFKCFSRNLQFATPEMTMSKSWVGIFRKPSYAWGRPVFSLQQTHCLAASIDNIRVTSVHVKDCDTELPVWCYAMKPPNTTSIVTPETGLDGIRTKLMIICLIILGNIIGAIMITAAVLFYVVHKRKRLMKQTVNTSVIQDYSSLDTTRINEQNYETLGQQQQELDDDDYLMPFTRGTHV